MDQGRDTLVEGESMHGSTERESRGCCRRGCCNEGRFVVEASKSKDEEEEQSNRNCSPFHSVRSVVDDADPVLRDDLYSVTVVDR